MGVNYEYMVVENELNNLKDDIRFRDFGFGFCCSFVLSVISIALTCLVGSVMIVNIDFKLLGEADKYVFLLLGLVFIIINLIHLNKKEKPKTNLKDFFRIKKKGLCTVGIVILISVLIVFRFFDPAFLYSKSIETRYAIYLIIYGFISLLFFLFVGNEYYDSEDSNNVRKSRRILHSEKIKYIILGVITGSDPELKKLSEYKEGTFKDKNDGMINRIIKEKELNKKFYSHSDFYKDEFKSAIDSCKHKIDISYTAAILSASISLVVTGYNKIVDAFNNYATVFWTADHLIVNENEIPAINNMPLESAKELAANLVEYAILFEILLCLILVCVFLLVVFAKYISNTRSERKLRNFRYAASALHDLQQAIPKTEENKNGR